MSRLQQFEQAEPLLLKALEGQLRVLGEDHQFSIGTMTKLVRTYDEWGKPAKAAEWRAKLLKNSAP